MKYLVTIVEDNDDFTMYYITGSSESFFVSLPNNYEKSIKIDILLKKATYTLLDDDILTMRKKLHYIFDKLNQKDNLLIIPILFDSYKDDHFTLMENAIENIVDYSMRMLKMRSIAFQEIVNLIILSPIYANFGENYIKKNSKRKTVKIDEVVKSDNILQMIRNKQLMKHPTLAQSSGYVFYSFLALIAIISYFMIMGIIFSRI